MKEILKNKYFWLNYFVLLILYGSSDLFRGIFTQGFGYVIVGKSIYKNLIIVFGFLLICILQVFVDLLLLYPLNWFFNKFTDSKNVICYFYSGVLLVVHIEYFVLYKSYKIDSFDLCLISTFISLLLFLYYRKEKLKKFSTWGLSFLNFIGSCLLFVFINTSQILLLTLFAKWLFELKKNLF